VTTRPPRTTQEFRRFVATHHPDRGGDPDVFAAGVQAWRAVQADDSPVVFYRRARRRRRLLDLLRRLILAPLRRGHPHQRRRR
jgi:hypothetical protein